LLKTQAFGLSPPSKKSKLQGKICPLDALMSKGFDLLSSARCSLTAR
jgi:hypothetical protein